MVFNRFVETSITPSNDPWEYEIIRRETHDFARHNTKEPGTVVLFAVVHQNLESHADAKKRFVACSIQDGFVFFNRKNMAARLDANRKTHENTQVPTTRRRIIPQ